MLQVSFDGRNGVSVEKLPESWLTEKIRKESSVKGERCGSAFSNRSVVFVHERRDEVERE